MVNAVTENKELAECCMRHKAACCKKGKLFITEEEFFKIQSWATANQSDAGEFRGRCSAYPGFFLYDQQESCQFLDDKNLCKLHEPQVKPTECFWWPLHVYQNEDHLEIRASSSCCDAFRALDDRHPYVDHIEEQAGKIGSGLLRELRKKYAGSYETHFIRRLHSDHQAFPSSIFLKKAGFDEYAQAGKALFPEADWDQGRIRVASMLDQYPSGILTSIHKNRIGGYVTLYPLRRSAMGALQNGDLKDEDINGNHIAHWQEFNGGYWLLTAVGIPYPEHDAIRQAIKDTLIRRIRLVRSFKGTEGIFAHAVTPQGRAFLSKLGFQYCSKKVDCLMLG